VEPALSWAAAAAWTGLLVGLRAGTTDLALRPERWETRAPLALVEGVLREPLTSPAAVDALEARLSSARGSAELLAAGWDSLGVPVSELPFSPGSAAMPDLPTALERPIAELVSRLEAARLELDRAVGSLSTADRARALAAVEAAVGDDPYAASRGKDFDAAVRFDLARLASAGALAARAVDEAIPELERARVGLPAAFSAKRHSPIGYILVSAGDAELGAEELAAAGLVVRLGGRTRYTGPAAAASEGQVRVVIDLGGPAVVDSTGPAAGSADFGIGLFHLLGPGPHEVRAGDRSLGAARFGVAYAAVSGASSRLASRRFSQGAAAFGVAALDTRAAKLELRAPLAAQGYGTTLGAGLWRHRGDDLFASCGFELTDPREPLGFMSFGQGAGMGPRAFAAGGVGAAHVTGDRVRLEGSYFAQGAGYWRGLGALFVRGDDARLKARRYGLGSGIHAAVGALDVRGKRARIEAWGVGPGFGWDYGLGLFRLRGDGARVRSDWAVGRADLGARSLSWIEGDGNELSLAGFGTGSYLRAQPGYALAVIKGAGNRLRAPGLAVPARGAFDLASTPWGVLRAEGDLTLDPALALPDPSWPPADAAALAARAAAERVRAAEMLAPPPGEDVNARIRRLLFAASAQILDEKPAETAARGLSALTARDAPALAAALDPDRFDELIWARLGAASIGPAAARAAAAEAAKSQGARRAALLEWLRFGRAVDGLRESERALRDPDWRVRRQAAFVLGALFSEEGGDEPGRRRLLRAASAGAATHETLGRKRLPDFYSALALAGPVDPGLRTRLLAAAGTPFDAAAPGAAKLFSAAVSSSPAIGRALAKEEADCARLAPRARALLRAAARDADDEAAAAALHALGGLGSGEDAPALADALSAPAALRREAAAAGLARLGPGARKELAGALADAAPSVRALAAVAAAQSWDPGVFELLRGAFNDAAPSVRSSAVAGLGAAQGAVAAAKGSLKPELLRLARLDPDAGVRASAAFAAAQLP